MGEGNHFNKPTNLSLSSPRKCIIPESVQKEQAKVSAPSPEPGNGPNKGREPQITQYSTPEEVIQVITNSLDQDIVLERHADIQAEDTPVELRRSERLKNKAL